MLQPLEPRRHFAVVPPTDVEQLLVELVNRARANPAAEAARFGIDLNEGLAAGTISATSKQPLAPSPYLTDAARRHSQWMIDHNVFSHTGANGTDPGARMAAAGYAFTPPWSWGENIAWSGSRPNVPDPAATAAQLHRNLFVDANYPGRGHRVNILNNAFKEIGPGVAAGEFNTWNAVMATEDFAYSGNTSFLTGVAYTDAVANDDFYTVGEGLGGVAVTARRTGDGATFSTQTWPSGGYSLPLPAGTYEVTAAGAAFGGTVRHTDVSIASLNVKRDFVPGMAAPASVVGRHVFYNNSAFDGRSAAADARDDNAIAPDKSALRPGQAASFANVTGYTRGINGVMVDVANLRGDPTAADFTLHVSTGPGAWAAAPAPTSVTRRPGVGLNGSDRVTLTWADGAIVNRWLRVTVRTTANTGLAQPDVFHFGNLVGETGNATAPTRVDAVDVAGTRAAARRTVATLTNRFDHNRDGRINVLDLRAARSNRTTGLVLLTA